MKKLIIGLLSVGLLAGCAHQKPAKPVDPIALEDLYDKSYQQDKIVYVDPAQYKDKKAALDKHVTYMLKRHSIVFESDLKYDNVSYHSAKITEKDRSIIPDLSKKYIVKTKNSVLGMTILLSKTKFYMANNTLDQKGYTYVAELKA